MDRKTYEEMDKDIDKTYKMMTKVLIIKVIFIFCLIFWFVLT
jgi:hypothetical protein